MRSLHKGVIFFCIILYMSCIQSECAEKKAATVFKVKGDVKVIPMGSNIGVQCKTGMVIKPRDWIRTGKNAMVTLSFDDNAENVVMVQENSLVIMKLDGYFKIQLLEGKINAILENVEKGEVFRALTPSVVTESTSSGWAVSSEGNYSTVVVVDGEAFICGINKDGSVKKKKYSIKEGFGRTTKMYEEPGGLVQTPASVMNWFKQQVVEHHLDQVIAKKVGEDEVLEEGGFNARGVAGKTTGSAGNRTQAGSGPSFQTGTKTDKKEYEPLPKKASLGVKKTASETRSTRGRNVAIIDGKEVDILEYLYRTRLEQNDESTGEDESNDETGKNEDVEEVKQ